MKKMLVSLLAVVLIAALGTKSVVAKLLNASADGLFEPYMTYATGGGYAVGIGDFNSDGLQDVAMTTSGQLLVLLQNSDGALAGPVAYDAGLRPESLAVGDLNNDGRIDVVVANYSSNTISVFLQQTDGSLAPRTIYPTNSGPDAIAVGDVNGDGLADVVVSHWTSGSIGVFTQNQEGALNSLTAYAAPQAGYDDIAIGDVNGDGRNDVVKMNGQGYANPNLSVYLQNADGTLDNAISYTLGCTCLSHGISIGDVTGDGRNDVVISYGGNRPASFIAVFAQGVDSSLLTPVSYSAYDIPEPVELGDLNMDGLLDVAVAHGGWYTLSVFPRENNGALGAYSLYALPYVSHYSSQGMAIGDINHDGLPDIAIADSNNGLVILRHAPLVVPMHVGDLTATNRKISHGWDATVTITVHDSNHAALANATVNGTWSGAYIGNASCTTDANGKCSLTTGSMPRSSTSVTFEVDNIVKSGYQYSPLNNHSSNNYSDGTSITIIKTDW